MPCCLKLHALTNLLMKPTNDMKQHIKEKDSYNITPNKANFISSLKATKNHSLSIKNTSTSMLKTNKSLVSRKFIYLKKN